MSSKKWSCPWKIWGINLHAFTGTFNPRKIRVMGQIYGKPLSILIDSGSTHNFIQDTVVQKMGLQVLALLEIIVFIGNGDFLVCKGVCR